MFPFIYVQKFLAISANETRKFLQGKISVGLPTAVIASWCREIDNQYNLIISISKKRFRTFVITLKISISA